MVRRRLIIGLILLILLISFMVYSSQEYYHNDLQYKRYTQLFDDPGALNNKVLSFSAIIRSVDTTNQTLQVFLKTDPFEFPAVEISTRNLKVQSLKQGDQIDVIGVVHGKGLITASQLWLVEPWEPAAVYVRSLLAIPFIAYLFLSTWALDTSTWFFDRRKKHV